MRGEQGGTITDQAVLYIHGDRQGSPAIIRDQEGGDHGSPVWSSIGTPLGDVSWESSDSSGSDRRPTGRVLTQAMRGKLPAARVVLNTNGRTPSRQAVLSALKEIQKRHSLPARSFHSLRHYFLSALVRGGANLEAVRELAGHSKLLTTQRYLHASGADLRDAVSRLPGNAKPLGN